MLFTKREEGREGGGEGEREISLEKSDNGIIRQNTDVEIQVPQGGPIIIYYLGEADNVRCFFCDGGLRNCYYLLCRRSR